MAKITLIQGDCRDVDARAGLVFTDPPYEINGKDLHEILSRFGTQHLVMLTTMRQLLQFMAATDLQFGFDFVLDAVVPKKSMSAVQPNYTHQTGVYLYAKGQKSLFDRGRRQRSDCFEHTGYWPTIIRAPRGDLSISGYTKNIDAITDILGSFATDSVLDPFAGSGTTGLAAYDLGLDCIMIEQDPRLCRHIRKTFKFMGVAL